MTSQHTSSPIVTIHEGQLKGIICNDARGGKFYSFLGIPYAKPPVGDLRFKAPQAIDRWNGVFDATSGGNICIQGDLITKEMSGSENCLNLNVSTPQLPSSSTTPKLKPVMVFIHGGSFLTGSNRMELHGPEILISEDIVLVAINYRLGLFGFLSFHDPKLDIPGNAAFKDMVLALKWVQRNVHHFMGDPNNVTIFGNSAGAAAVHFLMLSPMAKGLFHKALCQSGSAFSSWAYAHEQKEALETALGLEHNLSEEELYKYLSKASVEEIFKAQRVIDKESIKCNRYRFIGAVIEPKSWKGEKFFSEHPIKSLLAGRYSKVPLVMGYNSGDGMVVDSMVDKDMNYIYWTDKEYNVPGLLQLEKGSPLSKELGEEIVTFYFGNGKISRETHLQEFYDITTDNSFLRGILSSVQHHRTTSQSPIYMYRLSIDSNLCFYKKILGIELPGVCHADEIGYLFTSILSTTPEPGSIEDLTQRRMSRLWANFAKYGDPTPVRDPLLGEAFWRPVDSADRVSFLDINKQLLIDHNPEAERMKFWDKVYSRGLLFSKL